MAKQKDQWFIKGSINYGIISRAAKLPGKSLHVAMAILYLSGMQREKSFKLSGAALEKLGVGRQATYRALDQLEAAGLIRVRRSSGARPIVTPLGNWRTDRRAEK